MSRFLLAVVAACLGLVAIVALSAWYLERANLVRVAVARDSDDHQLMMAAASVMAREHEGVRFRLVLTDGSAKAAAALENGSADMAVVRTDIDMPRQGQTVAILQKSAVVILAPAGAGLTHMSDLRGRRIGIVVTHPGGMANARLLDILLNHYDASDGVEKISLTMNEVAAALTERRVDALVVVGVPSSGPLNDLVAGVGNAGTGGAVFIPVLEARALARLFPTFEPIEIPRGAFGGAMPRPANDVPTIGVSTRLVAHTKLAESTVADVARVLFTKRPLIAAMTPLANRMEAPATDKGSPLPVHPGAAAYLDGEEETFLEKYSDFIYIGAMLLSILASAAAALASRLSATKHARSEELMKLLLEHLAVARTASSAEHLDELEHEADVILGQALEAGTLRHLDTHRVTALGLAIDQLRLAIRDRRAQLERSEGSRPVPRYLAG